MYDLLLSLGKGNDQNLPLLEDFILCLSLRYLYLIFFIIISIFTNGPLFVLVVFVSVHSLLYHRRYVPCPFRSKPSMYFFKIFSYVTSGCFTIFYPLHVFVKCFVFTLPTICIPFYVCDYPFFFLTFNFSLTF